MGYVFISYSSKNREAADAVKFLLNKHNIDTWMAPYDIPVGSKYAAVIKQAIKNCSCFLLLLTHDTQGSVWVAKEVERAINYKKAIIPIQLEDVILNDEFEMYISTDQILAISKIDDTTNEIQNLIAALGLHTQSSSVGLVQSSNMRMAKAVQTMAVTFNTAGIFASCGKESTIFTMQKSADNHDVHLDINFEKTRIRETIPEYAGLYCKFSPIVDIGNAKCIRFKARSADRTISTLWVEIKPQGRAWMHESFSFVLESEYKEFVIDCSAFLYPATLQCVEEITFVIKVDSFPNESLLKGMLDISDILISDASI